MVNRVSAWEVHSSRIVEMRRSGYTLQEIGDIVGVTRERVRQLLDEHCGKIETPLLSERKVADEIGCSIWRLKKLRRQGILQPRHRGKYLYYYDRGELEEVKLAVQRHCLHYYASNSNLENGTAIGGRPISLV